MGSAWSARLGAGGCGIGLGCVKAGVQLPPGAFLVAAAEQIGCFVLPRPGLDTWAVCFTRGLAGSVTTEPVGCPLEVPVL